MSPRHDRRPASLTGRRPPLALRAVLAALLLVAVAPARAQQAEPAPEPAPTKKTSIQDKQARKELKRQEKEAAKRKKSDPFKNAPGRTASEWYAEAMSRYTAGKYLAAREVLLPLEDSVRARDIQEQVKLLIADTYFYQGGALNLAEALARYRTFLTFYPSSDKAEYVQFQIGNSYFRQLGSADRDQSYTDSAIAEYERFLQLYPDSQWAGEARSNMLEAQALKGRSEYEVGEFYWKWENYRAAAERLENVLRDNPALPERERALYMAAQSYYNIGDEERGHAFAARLAQDYPSSSLTGQLKSGAASAHAMAKSEKRDRKRDKEAARTAKRQARRDAKRTRQIRRDYGLPRKVPASGVAVAAEPASAPAQAPAVDAKADTKARKEAEKAEEKARKEDEKADKKAQEAEKKAEKKARKAEKQGESGAP